MGDESVGKTSLIYRIAYGHTNIPPPTIGGEIPVVKFDIGSSTDPVLIKMQLWDMSKIQREARIFKGYFKAASCIVLVFDETRHSTLASIRSWVDIASKLVGKEFTMMLVGNKCDLPSEIDRNEPTTIAEELGVPFFSVSAKTGVVVKEMFVTLAGISVEQDTCVDVTK